MRSTAHEPSYTQPYFFLLGREVGLDDDILTIRQPSLRTLTVARLPFGLDLGAVFGLVEPSVPSHPLRVDLEVLRPSGSAALSVSGSTEESATGPGRVWARTLHVVIDEAGEWTVIARCGALQAVRVVNAELGRSSRCRRT
ncbi:hypothetical protein DFP74_5356 [Nocardiopsis sp. Huas11]|uniref:hypothetical protein n=1 Tax=Nocardiopsis sp. Huas11 TaxID=2183912 RepID=UPI000EABD0DF|nr:hypothetical protein [Nocardiopsis sp. Huas11]RKS09614.1 hypothetical protein DFP74_5356 [Nocardiopsis sp. Huas11]